MLKCKFGFSFYALLKHPKKEERTKDQTRIQIFFGWQKRRLQNTYCQRSFVIQGKRESMSIQCRRIALVIEGLLLHTDTQFQAQLQ